MHEWILIEKLNAKTYVEILYSFYAVDPDLKLNRDQGQLRSTLKPLKHHRNGVVFKSPLCQEPLAFL